MQLEAGGARKATLLEKSLRVFSFNRKLGPGPGPLQLTEGIMSAAPLPAGSGARGHRDASLSSTNKQARPCAGGLRVY